MKLFRIAYFVLFYSVFNATGKTISVIGIDENWVCNIKKSCQDCLRLPQCSWCSTDNTCFSEQLLDDDNYCDNGITRQTNFSLSFEDNAKCACAGEEIVNNCRPSDVSESKECSGRGSCNCGRCFCDVPDIDNPSKVIVGEYCEFDNFSCDGPKCNEGPYYINDLQNFEENNIDEVPEVENPEE